jgi:predicted dehydrogenase
MPDKSLLSRRRFLKQAAGAGTLAAAPYFVPATSLGQGGATAPSDRIIVGAIGIQNRGMHDLRWLLGRPGVQFVAICDLQQKQRLKIKDHVDNHYGTKDCAMYPEINGFLEARPDIEVILTATGDRWHALASILSMRAGKDVYTEKPSCMTIAEGRAVVETARRYGRVYQTGTQRLSEANHVFCIEMARSGRLGEIHTAYAHIAPWDAAEMRHDWLPAVPEPPKEEVDWNAWLGACPWRPYNPAYVSGGWRGHYDFHTSCIGEWGAHTFAQAQAGLGCSELSPIEYEYVPNDSGDGMVTHFANGVKMILSRGNKYWHGSCGERFDGTEGWAAAADGYRQPDVSSPALLGEYNRVISQYVARTGRSLDHMQNFLDCVRSRERTVANPEVMHHSMTTVHAANICMWLKRSLKFDPAKEEFVGDDEANSLRSRAMREPYII